MSAFADKHLKVAIVRMFKELKENILKDIKEEMITVSQQIIALNRNYLERNKEELM